VNALLIRPLGASALAWGNGAGAAASAAFLWVRLHRASPAALHRCGATALKSLFLGALLAAVTSALWQWVPGGTALRLGVALAGAAAAFMAAAALLGLDERKHLWELMQVMKETWLRP